ncbi:MAG TPA: FtsX-like permease family protein [Bryobacteraceae bacterium]|nr:FtsX-like permease family protein [Bryobacteraceae bacterium]
MLAGSQPPLADPASGPPTQADTLWKDPPMRYLGLIFKNSVRNRRRSVLTIASIAISLCILGLLIAMYQAMFFGQPTPAQAMRLVTRHRVSLTVPMPIYYRDKIRAVPGVRDLMAWQWFGGTYKDTRDPNNNFPRFGTDPDHFFNVESDYQMPEDQKKAFIRERTGCIVSRTLADKMHFNLGDRITLVGDIFPVTLELKVVGVFDEPDKQAILYFSREYLREALGSSSRQQDLISAFLVQADSAADVPRVSAAIDDMFAASPFPTRSESEKAFQLSFISFLGNLRLFIMAICGAVMFTILLVSANTISMSVRERIREVGILKTLGFTPGAILGIVLGESAVIALIGGAIGCLLAEGMCSAVSRGPGGDFMPALHTLAITPPVGLICLGGALAIGLVSSFIPAWTASRTPILESLKYTG